ncbi:MAG: hypothetical protein R6V48_05280 [Fidelibacterota bacterium]
MPVVYDNYVKKPHEEIQYTPEQIQELAKCTKDIFHFCKYVKIVHPDEGRVQFKPFDFQKDIIDTYLKQRFLILLLARQVGKCLLGDTKITVRNKKTGKIEEIEIGEFYERAKKSV